MDKNCIHCKITISNHLKRNNKLFCSKNCYYQHNNIFPQPIKPCNFCSKQIKVNPKKNKNQKQFFCNRECRNKFRNIDPKDYRLRGLKYHGKTCQRCSYSDIRAIIVHHKDRNRKNNSIENLEVLCGNCHKIEHLTK